MSRDREERIVSDEVSDDGDDPVMLKDLPPKLCWEMEGPFPETSFVSNGITAAPQYIGAVDCRPAGHWHDYGYTIGGMELDRENIDYAFYRNLRHCGLGWIVAGIEFRRVRFWGIAHFRYDNPPRGLARLSLYVKCFFSRYLKW